MVQSTFLFIVLNLRRFLGTKVRLNENKSKINEDFCFVFHSFNRTFAPVKHCISFIVLMMLLMGSSAWGQTTKKGHVNPEDRPVDMDSPTFVPLIKVSKVMHEGDSIQYIEMNNVYVYPQPVFKNEKQRQAYNRLVYNVKKVLPIAK